MEEDYQRIRMASRDVKRLKTIRNRYGQAGIISWTSKAGKASPTKFKTSSSQAANRIRWARYYAANPDKLAAKIEKERIKEINRKKKEVKNE